jgi:hypothetical protein
MLTIWGIEATQATQFFASSHPLCTGPGATKVPCADNSVPLVAGKPIVLRLYVSGASPGDNLAGMATVPHSTAPFGPNWSVVGTGAMVASTKSASRLDVSTTIQILLNPHLVGTNQLDILVLNYGPNWASVVGSATRSITLTFAERRRIRIRLVRVRYTGRGMNIAAPTQQEFWNATDFAQRALPLPSPGFEVVADSVVLYDGDFTRIDPSAHDTTWPGYAANRGTTGSLLNILDTLVAAESQPPDVIYVAIYPNGVNQAAYAGWAVGRWIISDRSGESLAHEVLHHHGVPQHAPCGGPANVDPNYPNYPAFSPLPAASIGEVGFDCSSFGPRDPLKTYDLMAYCSPKWISPYNYQRAFAALTPLPPPPTPPPDSPGLRPLDVVDVSFVRFPPDHWVVVDVPRFPRPAPPVPPFPKSELAVQLLDERGGLLSTAPAAAVLSECGFKGSTEVVEAQVPWRNDAAAIALCHGREILARSPIAPAPHLDLDFPALADLEAGRGVVSFQTEAAHPTAVAVRVSVDAGATWLATIRHDGKGEVDLAPLLTRAGDECFLQVIASSGYHTSERTSERFRLRPRNQDILAWSSAADGHVSRSRPVELFAIANGGATSINDLSWYSDLQGDLGQGARLSVTLRPGRHRIEVRSCEPFHPPAQFDLDVD